MTINYREPQIRISDGDRLVTTSLAVSQHFGKKHYNVLRDIENLECSAEFNALNFNAITYQDGRQRKKPAYEITRDGFMFLCMGFTGKAAATWKERYIIAFNALEQSLHNQHDNIEQIQRELLTAKPVWRDIKRYKELGLNHAEIAKLLSRDKTTIRAQVRKMEACGIISPPQNLAKMQQIAFDFLPHLKEVNHA